jgi:hypothetical protein
MTGSTYFTNVILFFEISSKCQQYNVLHNLCPSVDANPVFDNDLLHDCFESLVFVHNFFSQQCQVWILDQMSFDVRQCRAGVIIEIFNHSQRMHSLQQLQGSTFRFLHGAFLFHVRKTADIKTRLPKGSVNGDNVSFKYIFRCDSTCASLEQLATTPIHYCWPPLIALSITKELWTTMSVAEVFVMNFRHKFLS